MTPSVKRRKGLDEGVVHSTLRDLQAGLVDLYGQPGPSVVVYGSYARHETTEDSDLDVLLVFARQVHASRELARLAPLLAELNLRYGMLLSVLPVTAEQYAEAEGPFWRNVRREGVGSRDW